MTVPLRAVGRTISGVAAKMLGGVTIVRSRGFLLLAPARLSYNQSRYIDFWRGWSAVVVFIGHLTQTFFLGVSRPFASLAGAAVVLFFCLSGFLIQKSISSRIGASFDWKGFALSRMNRILPPFVVGLGVTAALWLIAPAVFSQGTRDFLAPTSRADFSIEGLAGTSVFLNGFIGPTLSANGPLWSLSFEVWYYIAAGFAALAFTGKPIGWVVLPLCLTLAIVQKWFAVFGLFWVGGFVLSALHAHGKLARTPRVSVLPLIGAFTLVCWAPDRWLPIASLSFQLSVGGWFLSHLSAMLSAKAEVFHPTLLRPATFAYTLYVTHFPILLFFYGISPEPLSAFAASIVALTVAMALGPHLENFAPLGRRRRALNPDKKPPPI